MLIGVQGMVKLGDGVLEVAKDCGLIGAAAELVKFAGFGEDLAVLPAEGYCYGLLDPKPGIPQAAEQQGFQLVGPAGGTGRSCPAGCRSLKGCAGAGAVDRGPGLSERAGPLLIWVFTIRCFLLLAGR